LNKIISYQLFIYAKDNEKKTKYYLKLYWHNFLLVVLVKMIVYKFTGGIFKKLSDISNELVKLEPEQVVYQFLTNNLNINSFGLARIEAKSDTKCRVKVPLKDGATIEFLLNRPGQNSYSVRPWQVKEYKLIKPRK